MTVAIPGDYGKPRPALVVQSDFVETTSSVVVLLLTSTLSNSPLLRYAIEPSSENGLQVRSQIQIDKMFSVNRSKVGPTIGRLNEETIVSVTSLMALFLGIG